MKQNRFYGLLLSGTFFLSAGVCVGQKALEKRIEEIVKSARAEVGLAVLNLKTNQLTTLNTDKHLPMQSVYKFHLALAVLHEIDKGKLSLEQKILVKKSDLLPNLWSPMREKYPEGNVELPLSEILKYTVSESDNVGCDLLFKLVGGPKIVNDYIHGLGIKDVAIANNEQEIQGNWSVQFSNWSTATAAVKLLQKFHAKKLLSKNTQTFLWETMSNTVTGPNKIKGMLPKGTLVAHKTGYSGAKEGVVTATNDIGVVQLPNGDAFAIAVFVTNSQENEKTNDGLIAQISKAAWDYFLAQ